MSTTIFASKKHKQTTDEDDSGSESDVEDDFTDEPSEVDDSEDEEPRDSNGNSVNLDSYQGESFDIEDIVDLDSKDLADILLQKDLMLRKTIMKKVLVKEDWDM
jgi:hypothetical protein